MFFLFGIRNSNEWACQKKSVAGLKTENHCVLGEFVAMMVFM